MPQTSKSELAAGAAIVDSFTLALPLNALHSARRRALVGTLPHALSDAAWARMSSTNGRGAALDAASRFSFRAPAFAVSTLADSRFDRDTSAAVSVAFGVPLSCLFGVPVGQFGVHGGSTKLFSRAAPVGGFAGYASMLHSELLYTGAYFGADRAARHLLEQKFAMPADTKEGAQYAAASIAGGVGGVTASVASHVPNCAAGFSQLLTSETLGKASLNPSTWSTAMQKNAMKALGPRAAIGALTGVAASVLREGIADRVASPL